MKTLLAAIGLMILPHAAEAAVLEVNGSGQLTGATGVDVGGTSFNVSFLDGTCASVFGTCTDSSFAFNSSAQANLAGTALLEQVFLNSVLGAFDDIPSLTFGCGGSVECNALVPYYTFPGGAGGTVAFNRTTIDSTGGFSVNESTDLSDFPAFVYAKFTPNFSAVPEPSTWAMMLLGFGATGFALRRRQRTTVRFQAA